MPNISLNNSTLLGWTSQAAPLSNLEFTIYLLGFIILTICAGIASGQTIGLMSLDVLKLKLLSKTGNKSERKWALALLPLLKNPNFLLVSLLLVNAACLETMPIFLNKITSPSVAICVSIICVLFFGEVIPQAYFKHHSIQLGYYLLPFVYLTLFICGTISWPIAALLNRILKSNPPKLFTRIELKALIHMHESKDNYGQSLITNQTSAIKFNKSKKGTYTKLKGETCLSPLLTKTETKMLTGVLSLSTRLAMEIIQPLNRVNSVSSEVLFDVEFLKIVRKSSHSNLPVYSKNHENRLCGVIDVKKLMNENFYDTPKQPQTLNSYINARNPNWFFEVLYVSNKINLLELLTIFRKPFNKPFAAVTDELEFSSRCRTYVHFDKHRCNDDVHRFEGIDNYKSDNPNKLTAIGIITIDDILTIIL